MGADPPESSAGTSQFAAPPTVEPKAPESSRAGSRSMKVWKLQAVW
eukprot:CAMPEP_0175913590 /NCGR_PEP_ID=MMETSP0108-20121206/9345_1 /TAXON_ID=195067 ORGANISM="Goniomonas pacifica, Strain CCMP1869" /NCGR_SAMPLE_ID=MMETSP0108 /ASSEMBLY_ACC=CAM_ASM_000204 /LENGTH=45 /DNA_ID= /DNA_START= /DNA_END= /DNA_ORIENTATION=